MAGLIGTSLTLQTLGQATPTSTPFYTSFETVAVVTDPGAEFPDVESLFNPSTGVPPGFARSLVDVSIDVGADYLTIDFDNADEGTRFADGYENTYIFTFERDVNIDISSAAIDTEVTTLGLEVDDIRAVGNQLFVNVEGLSFTTETFVRIEFDSTISLSEEQRDPADLSLVASTYQFFTSRIPELFGFAYLISSPNNDADINDPYYEQFNIENMYINFANNLASFGEGASGFAASYGELSFKETIEAAYEEIVGKANATASGIDPDQAVSFFLDAYDYYAAVASERVVSGGVSFDQAVKVVAVGSILNEAIKADVGKYAEAVGDLVEDLHLTGTTPGFGADLFG